MYLLGTVVAHAQPVAALLACERLASSPVDSERSPGVPGVPLASLDSRAAIAACEEAVTADPGDRRANYHLGRALVAGRRSAEAVRPYRASAEAGFALAQNNLGSLLSDGTPGVAADPMAGFAWYLQAANNGLSLAMHNVAVSYRDGLGVARNPTLALDWAGKAASAGYAPARAVAAAMLESGEGIGGPRLLQAAAYWRAMAADGDTEAARKLGGALLADQVFALSSNEAEQVLTRALREGSAGAGLMIAEHLMKTAPGDAAKRGRAADLAKAAYITSRDARIDTESAWLVHQRKAALQIFEIEKTGPLGRDVAAILPELRAGFGNAHAAKAFEVPLTCGTQKSMTPLFVWDWDRDEPQTNHQIRWYRAARGCEVSAEIEESFRKIFAIARQNKVSFLELAIYALGAKPEPAAPPSRDDEVISDTDALREITNVQIDNQSFQRMRSEFIQVSNAISRRLAMRADEHRELDHATLGNWERSLGYDGWGPVVDLAKTPNLKRGQIVAAAKAQAARDVAFGACQLELAKSEQLEPLYDIAMKAADVLDLERVRDGLHKAIGRTCNDAARSAIARNISPGMLFRQLDRDVIAFRHAAFLDPAHNPVSIAGLEAFQKTLKDELARIGKSAEVRRLAKATPQMNNEQAASRYMVSIGRGGCPSDSRLCALVSLFPALDDSKRFCELAATALARRPLRNGSPKAGTDGAFAADIFVGWMRAGLNHCRWQRPQIADGFIDAWGKAGLSGVVNTFDGLGAIGGQIMVATFASGIDDENIKQGLKVRANIGSLKSQHERIVAELSALK